MTTQQLKAEMGYHTAKALLRQMVERGLLLPEEYEKAVKQLSIIYMPPIGGLCITKA